MTRSIFTVAELADALDVTPRAIRYMVRKGMPHVRSHRRIYIDRAQAETWLVATAHPLAPGRDIAVIGH